MTTMIGDFKCSIEDLATICIEMEIKKIAKDPQNEMLAMYGNQDGVTKYGTEILNMEWISEAKIGGPEADKALEILKLHKNYNCNLNGQNITCLCK